MIKTAKINLGTHHDLDGAGRIAAPGKRGERTVLLCAVDFWKQEQRYYNQLRRGRA